MAILFMLAVDCGSRHDRAVAIVEHFRGVAWTLSNGTEMRFTVGSGDIWRRSDVTWCSVFPDGMSATGSDQSLTSLPLRVEVSRRIHAELRAVSGFRFALLGWEAATECSWDEIIASKNSLRSLPAGLIMNKRLWIQLGEPSGYERFGSDTVWRPLDESGYRAIVRSFGEDN